MSSTLVPKVMAAATILCCAIAGCGRTVGGTATAGSVAPTVVAAAPAPIPLVNLLLDPGQFPADYPAATLDAAGAQTALAMVDGVPAGASVTPPDCAPPKPNEIAAAEGVHDTSTLRVVLTRGAGALSVRRDQVARCLSFSAVSDVDGAWEVSVEMLPPPVLNADGAFAVEQTQTEASIFHSLTLVGQVGDVRVMAQLMGLPDEPLDAVTLDALFTAAVQKVRRGG